MSGGSRAEGTTELAALTCNRGNSLAYLSRSVGSLEFEYGMPLPSTKLPLDFLKCTSDRSKHLGDGHTYMTRGRPRPFLADEVHRGEFSGHCGLQGDALKSMKVESGAGQRQRLETAAVHCGQGRGFSRRNMVIASCGRMEMGCLGWVGFSCGR